MFILHSFVLAAILYFVMVRSGVYFERLLYVCVLACVVQATVVWIVPLAVVHDTSTAQQSDRSWMEAASSEVEDKRATVGLVVGILFYLALGGFLLYWYQLEPIRAAAIVGAFASYQYVLGFLMIRVMLMLSSTQQQKIGF